MAVLCEIFSIAKAPENRYRNFYCNPNACQQTSNACENIHRQRGCGGVWRRINRHIHSPSPILPPTFHCAVRLVNFGNPFACGIILFIDNERNSCGAVDQRREQQDTCPAAGVGAGLNAMTIRPDFEDEAVARIVATGLAGTSIDVV